MDRYCKSFFAYEGRGKRPVKVTIRNYGKEDFAQLIDIQRECFPPPFPSELWWNEEQLTEHVTRFPEGALCAEVEGELVGSMTALKVNFDRDHWQHTWAEVTDNGYIRNHDFAGNSLYVVDISVRPSRRKLGLGKSLMQSMYELVIHQQLQRLVGGGRMSGYHKMASQMSAEQYLNEVITGSIQDPVITFLLRCGRQPVGVAAEYLEDAESLNYAAIMEWPNPFVKADTGY
ncbi:GNAT family N-acetyltransferase [Paenibacillus senegalensis]|uniref:GNAT family N-acetyltransferase n=1 Tax=Paenibacillus senegalensis TaxID=1465766 RepID=UPI000289D579|nr:GNAT family N-acetyltransferase [Paenibacillus senegalensis]